MDDNQIEKALKDQWNKASAYKKRIMLLDNMIESLVSPEMDKLKKPLVEARDLARKNYLDHNVRMRNLMFKFRIKEIVFSNYEDHEMSTK